jgi:hypothetical protein
MGETSRYLWMDLSNQDNHSEMLEWEDTIKDGRHKNNYQSWIPSQR